MNRFIYALVAAVLPALASAQTVTQYECTGPNVAATVTITIPPPPPPPPVDCAGTWAAWTPGPWSACANGTQSRTESRAFTVTTAPANGGAACPASPETRTVSQDCTVPPPPPPPPVTDATSVLDNFEGPVRQSSEGVPIWHIYSGPATVSYDASCARFGAKGLKVALTSSGVPYLEFYPYINGWKKASSLATNYQTGKYNRFGFWYKTPVKPSANEWTRSVEWGNYYTGDGSANTGQGTHLYGFLTTVQNDWTYVEFDSNQQALQSANTTDPAPVNPEYKFFDTLTRFYFEMVDNAAPAGSSICFDEFAFRQETGAEDIASIASLEASYNVAAKRLHIGFQRGRYEDPSFTARWSPTKFQAGGFSAGTLLGTSGPNGAATYSGKRIEGTANLTGLTEVYIAVQKAGSATFRQIRLAL